MIYDNPQKRTNRPGSGKSENEIGDVAGTKRPDISGDLAAIDKAIKDATKAKQRPKKDRCGCW